MNDRTSGCRLQRREQLRSQIEALALERLGKTNPRETREDLPQGEQWPFPFDDNRDLSVLAAAGWVEAQSDSTSS
jgi:hypothetical protein